MDYEVLQQFPAGGSVLHLVPQMVEDDTPRTEESDTPPTDADFVETTGFENGPQVSRKRPIVATLRLSRG